MNDVIPWIAPAVGFLVIGPMAWRARPSARAVEARGGGVRGSEGRGDGEARGSSGEGAGEAHETSVKGGGEGAVDRLHLIASGAEIVAVLALVRFIGTWTPWSILGWYALVAVAAVAAAGLVLRALPAPWIVPGARSTKRRIATALSLAVSGTIVAATAIL